MPPTPFKNTFLSSIKPSFIFIFTWIFIAVASHGQQFQTIANGCWHDHVWANSQNPTYTVLGNNSSVLINHEIGGNQVLELGHRPGGKLNINNKLVLKEFLLVSKNNWEINIADNAELVVEKGIRFDQSGQGNSAPTLRINGTARISGGITGTGSITGSGELYVDHIGSNITVSNNWSGTIIISENPLPIELLSFTAKATHQEILLNWTTGSEINNDYFTIERSNNLNNWEVLSYITGAGNSNMPIGYSFIDSNPIDGIAYYRLKQTDFDGQYKYYGPVVVQFNPHLEGLDFKVLKQYSTWVIALPNDGVYQVDLYNIQGHRLFSQSAKNNLSFEAPGGPVLIKISDGLGNSASRTVL